MPRRDFTLVPASLTPAAGEAQRGDGCHEQGPTGVWLPPASDADPGLTALPGHQHSEHERGAGRPDVQELPVQRSLPSRRYGIPRSVPLLRMLTRIQPRRTCSLPREWWLTAFGLGCFASGNEL